MGEIVEELNYGLGNLEERLHAESARRYLELGVPESTADIMADERTVPLGVFGTGAWIAPEGVVPAIFVHHGMAPRGGAPVGLTGLGALFDGRSRIPFESYALPMEQPTRYALSSPGDGITVGSRRGTLGWAGRCRSTGKDGFVTAGHVAPNLGAIVRNSQGDRIGEISKTLPQDWLDPSVSADVAFAVSSTQVLSSMLGGIRSPRAREGLRMQTQNGTRSSWVRGLSPEYWVSPSEPPWGQVALTADAISQPGDSGAPVYGVDNHLIGMLVGGATSDYSVVQDVVYQMENIQVDLN